MVTVVQRYVFAKLEVSNSMTFLFRENRRHEADGRTYRRTNCNN